jgi:hypothetical protein
MAGFRCTSSTVRLIRISRQATPSIATGMIRWLKNRFRSDGGGLWHASIMRANAGITPLL